MDDKITCYKWCFVPMCTNTSVKTPNKIFVTVPKEAKRRKAWLKAVRRGGVLPSPKSALYCCEDHFNVEEDIENMRRHILMPGTIKLFCKKNVVPHIFDCQPTRSAARTLSRKSVIEKRNSARVLAEALEMPSHNPNSEEDIEEIPDYVDATVGDPNVDHTVGVPNVDSQNIINFREVGVQCRQSYRSKSTMCKPSCLGLLASVHTSPLKTLNKNASTSYSPAKQPRLTVDMVYSSSEDTDVDADVSTLYAGGEESSEDSDENNFVESDNDKMKSTNLDLTRFNVYKLQATKLEKNLIVWHSLAVCSKVGCLQSN